MIPLGEPLTAYKCQECGELVGSDDLGGKLYECGACGTKGVGDEGRRCPDCNKFAAKVADICHEDCPGEVEEVEAYHCDECDLLLEEDDAKAHECGAEPDVATLPKPPFAEGDTVEVDDTLPGVILHQESPKQNCRGPGLVAETIWRGRWMVSVNCIAHRLECQPLPADHLVKVAP